MLANDDETAPVSGVPAVLSSDEKTAETAESLARKLRVFGTPIEVTGGNPAREWPHVETLVRPRSIQSDAVEAFFEAVDNGQRRVIVSLPTGAGKTIFGLIVASKISGRVLWIAHRDELIDQPEKEIQESFPGLSCGVVKAERSDGWDKRVAIASLMTLAQKRRLIEVLHGGPISAVIYDECHHATAVMACRILGELGCMREDKKGPILLGLTATIERSDKISLGEIFEDVVYSISIQEAIEMGFLVPPTSVKVVLPINPRAIRVINGEVNANDIEKELTRVNAAAATAAAILANCKGRKTICFNVSVDQARRTAEACTALGLRAEWVSGMPHMSKKDRQDALKRFSIGDIDVLANAEVCSEGYDERSISAVVIARPTMSRSKYLQMAGRGLRTAEHKVDCLIVDLVSASDFGFVSANILLEKPPTKKRKKRSKSETTSDINNEWSKISSYLRSTKADWIEHGEITFAKASEDLIVTVAADSDMVVLRRVEPEGDDVDRWFVEHGGTLYTPMPLTLQEAMRFCDSLIKDFGGAAKPGTDVWDSATLKPAPMPVLMPDVALATPVAALPMAIPAAAFAEKQEKLNEDRVKELTKDTVDALKDDISARHAEMLCRGLARAMKAKRCNLCAVDRQPPNVAAVDVERFGWTRVPGKTSPTSNGEVVGFIHVVSSVAFAMINTSTGVAAANRALKGTGFEVSVARLKKFGSTKKLFKMVECEFVKIPLETLIAAIKADA